MAATTAERKAKERDEKRAQGLEYRGFWLDAESQKIINDYASENNCKKDEAINALIKRNQLSE